MSSRARPVGINHVALEVGSIEQAIAFYRRLFEIELGPDEPGMAFIQLGDQFIALVERPDIAPQEERHFGLVVDDKDAVRHALQAQDIPFARGRRLNFRDPWGNHIQVVDYRDVQFTKAPGVLDGMRLSPEKRPHAIEELRNNGLL